MTNEERLSEIKSCLDAGIKVWGIGIHDIEWLVGRVLWLERENQLLYKKLEESK